MVYVLLTTLAALSWWFVPVPTQALTCEPSHRYYHPLNCSLFIMCGLDSNPYIFQCPSGLHFNEEKEYCDWPSNARCENEHEEYSEGNLKKDLEAGAKDTVEKVKSFINKFRIIIDKIEGDDDGKDVKGKKDASTQTKDGQEKAIDKLLDQNKEEYGVQGSGGDNQSEIIDLTGNVTQSGEDLKNNDTTSELPATTDLKESDKKGSSETKSKGNDSTKTVSTQGNLTDSKNVEDTSSGKIEKRHTISKRQDKTLNKGDQKVGGNKTSKDALTENVEVHETTIASNKTSDEDENLKTDEKEENSSIKNIKNTTEETISSNSTLNDGEDFLEENADNSDGEKYIEVPLNITKTNTNDMFGYGIPLLIFSRTNNSEEVGVKVRRDVSKPNGSCGKCGPN